MAPKKFRKLPSAARFCTKRFRHIEFWTFFLSISWKFFRVLNIEKNTFSSFLPFLYLNGINNKSNDVGKVFYIPKKW